MAGSSTLDPRDLSHVVERYQRRIAEHGATFESMCSGNQEKQRARQEMHASALRRKPSRVLDVGCGVGSFLGFLEARNIPCQYTGYDVVPEYIEECRRRYGAAHFEVRNVFSDGIEGTYDTIVMTSVLNNRYRHSDNLAVMAEMLEMAYEHTEVSVSIDMMSTYVDFQNPEVFYYSPEKIFSIAKGIARRVVLRHDYRAYEFCIQLFHEDAEGFVP